MGMFDNIHCEYKLPNKKHQNLEYQTKDLENFLDLYTITEEGHLIHHSRTYEAVPEEKREHYGTPEWDKNPILQMCGSIKSIYAGDIDVNYEGTINFYTMGSKKEWIEYEAAFVGGSVIEIKFIEMNL